MLSTEALIATTALMAGFGVLLFTINEIKEPAQNSLYSLEAKNTAEECAAMINSIYSNSADDYNTVTRCTIKGKMAEASKNGKIKTSQIFTDTNMTNGLYVKTSKHYLDSKLQEEGNK
ncbi:MAG: hypothetical protein NTY48_03640 [Candidatus Diapherotrites archaeon]|nr:hypothetical protein [Candidatus Diapherotrites archaeon]